MGKGPGKYNLYLGGNQNGTRIPRLYEENVDNARLLTVLDELIASWARDKESDEGFGDFVVRTGVVKPVIDSARDFYE